MPSLRIRRASRSLPRHLTTLLLAMGIAGRTVAAETLHIAIFGCMHREELRAELMRRAGSPELPNERAKLLSPEGRFIEDLHVHWQQPLVDGLARFDGLGTPPRGGERKTFDRGGVTIEVKKVAGADGDHFLFDIDTLQPALEQGYYRFRTSGLPVPVCPNAWVEVTDWHLPHRPNDPIFCYLESPQAAPATEATAKGATAGKTPSPEGLPFGNDPRAPWRLEVRYGSLPGETLKTIQQADAKEAALAADTVGWFRYGVPCLSGKTFRLAVGAGEEAKRKHDDYHERRLSKLEGTLTVVESGISLKCGFHPPVVREKDARVIPFEGELRPGVWRFHPIPDGPDHASMGEFPGGPAVRLNVLPPINVAAFRVVKLEVR